MKTIKKNTQVTVKRILGETAEVLVTRLDNGKYQFNCDAYVVGEIPISSFHKIQNGVPIVVSS